MSIVLAITVASLGANLPVQDTSISVTAVYAAVLEHAAPRYPSRAGLSVVISERSAKGSVQCSPHCVDSVFVQRRIDADVVQQLKNRGLIAEACTEPERTIGCATASGRTFIRLGVPYRLPAGLHVLPGEGLPAAILRITGSEHRAESVDVGIDVLVYGPCPPERSPCEFPDIVLFRYFLKAQPDRSYRVVARMQTGAV